MKKNTTDLKKCLMYFSRQSREERAYHKYTNDKLMLEKLSINRLKFQLITLKTKYEYKRNVCAIFLGTILLTILTGTWGTVFDLTRKIIEYAVGKANVDPLLVKGWTLIILIFFITATFLIFITALSFMRTLYQLHEEILMVEDVLKAKKEDRK
ncbi:MULTISPECIES: hypothetical protein [Enterococcus]|uniref:DUF4231 domain-containing protein n=2 Tax=Enterococcus gallinarum TaxID=1353 RepID=A0ABD4ZXG5_ENTGA|nr:MULTISPECIES: hypothetical protein [Enterococcus]MBF0825267.1 hypothetical protein [Enterococcus faecalis]MBF0798912.1 hypothetical protein [Enterococcus gallinarum]MBX8979366.1 hypothetical protein [Enterococcus gallinarum]MCR1929508.1 hypothetical protein [Enterococcus gallinarum]MCR1932478.1 hypothetical protein [Enterococcus gallinarum]